MKEIVLSVKRQKTEIKIFCVCIALALSSHMVQVGPSFGHNRCGCCSSPVAFTGCRSYFVCCITEYDN